MMDMYSERVQTMLDINNDPDVLNNDRLCEAISVVIQELHNIRRNKDAL